MGRDRGRGWLPAAAAVALLVLPACSGAHDPAGAAGEATQAPAPDPVASPTATEAPLVTVAGERAPAAHWVNSAGLLTGATPEAGPGDAVLPLAHAVGDWLDGHLDDLQRGGGGHLDRVASEAFLATAAEADLAAISTDLAAPGRPVAAASYQLSGSYDETTEWLTATVQVTDRAGATNAATLVFVPGEAGPELVLFGPAVPATPGSGGDT